MFLILYLNDLFKIRRIDDIKTLVRMTSKGFLFEDFEEKSRIFK